MRIGAVIAAAGRPGGFSSYDGMEYIEGSSMVRRMIGNFRRAGVEDIAVVTGYRAEETEKSLMKLGVAFLRADDHEEKQMLDFAVQGLSYLSNTCGRIFFCPSDVPLFSEKTIRKMMEDDSPVVIPVCGGRKGHPVLIDSGLTEHIAAYTGERGLKGALDDSGAKAAFVQVDDRGVLTAAGKDPCFEETAQYEFPARIYPRVKVQLVRNVPFFGPGMMVVLKQIQILGNVREACEKAGMSYSKGWSLIRTAEKELGWVIVERSPGGKYGGTARVSEKGQMLMECYEKMEREIAEEAEKKYREILGKSGLKL